MKQATITTTVVPTTSVRPGQLTFFISTQTSRRKSRVLGHHSFTGTIGSLRSPEDGRRKTVDVPCHRTQPYSSLSSSVSRLPFSDSGFSLAGVEGFEPPTYGFGDRRSTN